MYLTHTVCGVPIEAILPDGQLKPAVRQHVESGTVRVIAGAEKCHVVLRIWRPYYREYPVAFLTADPTR